MANNTADTIIGDLDRASAIYDSDLFLLEHNGTAMNLSGAQVIEYAQNAVGTVYVGESTPPAKCNVWIDTAGDAERVTQWTHTDETITAASRYHDLEPTREFHEAMITIYAPAFGGDTASSSVYFNVYDESNTSLGSISRAAFKSTDEMCVFFYCNLDNGVIRSHMNTGASSENTASAMYSTAGLNRWCGSEAIKKIRVYTSSSLAFPVGTRFVVAYR